jgi:hypothetical protein
MVRGLQVSKEWRGKSRHLLRCHHAHASDTVATKVAARRLAHHPFPATTLTLRAIASFGFPPRSAAEFNATPRTCDIGPLSSEGRANEVWYTRGVSLFRRDALARRLGGLWRRMWPVFACSPLKRPRVCSWVA